MGRGGGDGAADAMMRDEEKLRKMRESRGRIEGEMRRSRRRIEGEMINS